MFRELLDLLCDLDADTITVTSSRVNGVIVHVSLSRDGKLFTMTHVIPVWAVVVTRDQAALSETIKSKWAETVKGKVP